MVYQCGESETGVLGPRPKFWRLHTLGLATRPNLPNKERSNGEGQRKGICCMTQGLSVGRGKVSKLAHPEPPFGVEIQTLALNTRRIKAGLERYTQLLNSPG
jgi:hypothetical protein